MEGEKIPNPIGRPTKYKPEYVELAYKYCLLGATDAKLAFMFDVSIDTITEWKNVYPDFSASVKKGKFESDATIADSLYHRAKGMTLKVQEAIKLTTKRQQIDKDTGKPSRAWESTEDVKIVTLENEIPPDTTAAIFWLKNRQPKEWRDRVEVATDDGVFTPEERMNRIKALREKLKKEDDSEEG